MLHFIAGVLVGSLAATYAIALVSNNEDALREQKIRELRTANRTLQEEYASAQRMEMYWRARCLQTTLEVPAVAPELSKFEALEAETCD